ncbi:MAG: IS3 family transposase [Planctomycetia bacterium]|nr:IS3 family transposase [Planctomycetia bacterium]
MPHDTRDQIVDYIRDWSCKSDIPVSLLLRWVGIAASKYHDWKRRFGKLNEHNSSVPRDHWLTDDEKVRIHTFARAHPLEGYRRLTFMMLDADVVACSPTSVYRVLKAANLLAGSSPLSSKKGTGFVQPVTPHCHWHIDVSYLNIAGTFYFLCSVLDGYSRAIVHHEIREKMEESDIEVILQRAREAHPGVTPRIISDNGPQFLAKDFKEFIRVAGMTHVKTSPYYPQSNGKIERWHKTLKGESIRVSVPLSLEDARRIVADYVTHYNTVRLHSAIGYVTPKDKLEGRDKAIFAARDQKLAAARERRAQMRQRVVTDGGGTECQRVVTDDSTECQRVVTDRPTIDFEAVKSRIGIAAVLKLLGVEVSKSQHRGACPLHGSTSGTSRCFSANGQKNVFHCFKCGQSGNALDLWAKATQQTPYDAALDLCARLGLELPTLTPVSRNREEETVNSESLQ